MALISEAKGRREGSGYERLFGNADLGYLMSRVQATVISSGSELERFIKAQVNLIPDLDEFLELEIMPDGVFLADKKMVKKSQKLDFAGAEPDFIIFKRREGVQRCHLVELKDGDTFDTKKAAAEHANMYSFISHNAKYIPYIVQAHFCSFNQDSRKSIVIGFKNKITEEEAMTGREFCDLIELDYDEIIQSRTSQGPENIRYFLSELLRIDVVLDYLKKTGWNKD